MNESDSTLNRVETRVAELVGELTAGTPLYPLEVNLRGSKGSRVLDVFVDSDDALDASALARLSRELSVLLDVEDLIDGHFNLNVSSPGLDRPLTSARQFKKNVGRRVSVTVTSGPEVSRTEGVLVESDTEEFEIETSDGERERFARADSLEIKVLPPW
jgi:ribosome maturation factor RimP